MNETIIISVIGAIGLIVLTVSEYRLNRDHGWIWEHFKQKEKEAKEKQAIERGYASYDSNKEFKLKEEK